jgi:hypothetical protein
LSKLKLVILGLSFSASNLNENALWGKVVKVRDAAADAKIKTLTAHTKETTKP